MCVIGQPNQMGHTKRTKQKVKHANTNDPYLLPHYSQLCSCGMVTVAILQHQCNDATAPRSSYAACVRQYWAQSLWHTRMGSVGRDASDATVATSRHRRAAMDARAAIICILVCAQIYLAGRHSCMLLRQYF